MVGRRYLITWVDQNFMRVVAEGRVAVTKMHPNETIVLQFTTRAPLGGTVPQRASVIQGPLEGWGELQARVGAWSFPPHMPDLAASYLVTWRPS